MYQMYRWIHHRKPLAHESHQLRRLPHGKISLTPHDGSSFNLVLPFSNNVRLETALELNLMGAFWICVGKQSFLLYFLRCILEMKSPLGIQKFNLLQKRLDKKLIRELGRLRCKISLKFVSFSKVIIYAWYRAVYIQWIDLFDFYRSQQSVL